MSRMPICNLKAGTRARVEVHGRDAKLFVNGSENPSLIVNGLKGEDLKGGIALWGYAGEEAYFSNVRVVPAEPEHVANDGEASGGWGVEFASNYGKYKGSMDLHREGNVISGVWSGDFGQNLPISGTWRKGYIELTFNGTWPRSRCRRQRHLPDGLTGFGQGTHEGGGTGRWAMDCSTEK